MKKGLRRTISLVLSLVMVITGMNILPERTQAAVGEEQTLPTSQEITQLSAPEEAYLYDFRTNDEGYKIIFTDIDEENYTVAAGDVKSFDVYMGTEKIATVSQSGDQIDLSTLNMTDGQTYEITVKQVLTRSTAEGSEILESAASAKNYFTYDEDGTVPVKVDGEDTGIAKVFVTTTRSEATKNHNLYTSGDKVDVQSALVVKNADGSQSWAGNGTIKLRGNSTSTGQKKPYNIKFSKKTDVLGFGKAKKWSLLANTFDKALIRNQIGMQFHNYVEDNFQDDKFSSKCEPIDLYLDGKYLGSYLLLESVEAGETRVDIDAENPDVDDILLELDSTGRDTNKETHLSWTNELTKLGMGFTINEPGEDIGGNAAQEDKDAYDAVYGRKKESVTAFINSFENVIENGGDGTLTEIEKYIDVDTFVNFYVTAEFMRITDVGFSSVRYYIKDTGVNGEHVDKMYCGPLWDMDLSSGNADGDAANPDNDMHAKNDNAWFKHLMMNEEFAARVKTRYEELVPKMHEIVKDGGTIDQLYNTILKSATANYSDLAWNQFSVDATGTNTGWGVNKIYTAGHHECSTVEEARATGNVSGSLVIHDTYKEYVDDFKAYLTGRITYMTAQLDAVDYDVEYTDITDQIGSYAYNLAKKKTATVYKNCHQEGKLEYLNDGQVDTKCPITNADSTGAWGTEGQPVYATIDLGKYYKADTIEKIVVQYNDSNSNDTVQGREYKIQYSIDGKNFNDVVSVESASLDENNRTIDDVSNVAGAVRYVRLYVPKQATYGIQVTEFAVLDTNKQVETVEGETVADVTNLVLTAPADNQIGVQFDASETENVTYTIYVDGEVALENAAAGQQNIIENVKKGTRTVKVEVMNANGFVSEGVSGSVTVTGMITVEDMLTDTIYNLAYQQSYTLSSGESQEGTGSVTDGLLGSDNAYYATPTKGTAGSWFTIDLGKEYDASGIDSVYVWYRNNFGGCYPESGGHQIQYSSDNDDYVTVATVSQDELNAQRTAQNSSPFVITVDIENAKEKIRSVRYVRIYYPAAVAYGAQVTEIGVFDTDGDAKEAEPAVEVSEAAAVTAVSPAYNTIEYTITPSEGQDGYTYNVSAAGQSFRGVQAGTYTIKGVASGTYTVTVKSVDTEGNVSKGITSDEVTVEDSFVFTTDTLAGRLLPDTDEYGNNYLRYTGISAEASSGTATEAIDNNADTRWESAQSDPQEIIVNLGAVYNVKEIALVWETASSKDYTVEVSTDGIVYETVAVVTEQVSVENKYDKIVLTNEVAARFIKINGTSRTTGYGHSIWEMAVYGQDAQKVYEPILSTSSDLDITGYQISTSFGGEEKTGIRTIYQREELVENQEVSEFGLVMGYADGITEPDKEMIVGNDSQYVMSYPATEDGRSTVQMGESPTALYYIRTMDIAGGYDADYMVRAYAKLADGSIVYSTVKTFNVYNIATSLYNNGKMPNYKAHQSLYDEIISKVDSTAVKVDYNWNGTLVNKPETTEGDVKIEGYQMSSNLDGIEGKLGLRIVYSVEGQYEEVGLVYGLIYGSTPITADDMLVDSSNEYVKSYAATEAGKLDVQLGASDTAGYYARTMNVSGLNKAGYTVSYMVRAYAKTTDGNVVYSNVYTYNINDVASVLYDNDLMSTASGHNAIYTNILIKVNPDYKEVDYDWSNAMVK